MTKKIRRFTVIISCLLLTLTGCSKTESSNEEVNKTVGKTVTIDLEGAKEEKMEFSDDSLAYKKQDWDG